ncbi:Kinesin-like protein [Quillaja saponaria]|uniref:Kinesin-like protein n=1 Tax=Quillaja saponaria TaxID=32244 RepID=A0AAD7KZM9_QUISA|nr:Kinesin-like protein [Quillaja saponaria]
MPFLSDTASAIKSRFGFHDHSSDSVPPVRGTPILPKSASRENFAISSAVRNISQWDDEGGVGASSVGSSNQSFEFHEDPSFWKDHNVQVIIRVRPLSNTEISSQGYSKCIRQESGQTITWTGHPESRFTFDIVADENVSQEKLFKVAGLPMVENCMGGYNSCMFAYGQTGSGKTHTMLGDIEGGTRRHSVNCGMTPRVFDHLFSRIQKEKEARRDEKLRFTCKCSFLEIYNEQILDLMEPSSNNLQLREDSKKGVYVENLKEVEVTSARDVIQQLIQGAANRKVAATNMNLASSRSHSVFTCIIESKWESQGVVHHRFARLNLVDLAGSERQKSSGAEGERLKEATNINKSLSTLGLVIMNLVSISNGRSLHVPYRDSKLTFLLQDSLGGNSKTTIIANISPASCCSLETLSTLKFAQRAKFIKNNAIVNEDASGDVIAMRMQIQQLKKEVSHLRGLVDGGAEIQNNDTLAVSFPGSPGSYKWEELGSLSPLISGKRMSQKKDYDVALVGAFRREKEKAMALQALAAENQATLQLAKQREDEIQGLKMRLRFREAGIKRLEAVASGKISAETHLLKENEEHLKEIEVLRAQVDRNQEVTRFAMENLRLKEEIRRLKSFSEEGKLEAMNEQIIALQNKLLEALDWKLMHDSDPVVAQKANSDTVVEEACNDGNLLISNQEPKTPWQSSIQEENEFLRGQAIQNQAEMVTLRKKLEFCLDEKEKLERHINDLVAKLEAEKSSRAMKEGTQQIDLPSLSTDAHPISLSDQLELKTMVDAIAAASHREAEAHETAIILSKENDELRMKLKVLIEDNNKLIELYERAAAESNYKNKNKDENAQDGIQLENRAHFLELAREKEIEMKKVVENLEHQLLEMNEENEKLMSLYERAMQERDDLKRLLSSCGDERIETPREFDCPEKLVEVDGGECSQSGEPPSPVGARNSVEETGCQKLEVKNEGEIPESQKHTSCGDTNVQTRSSLCLEDFQQREGNHSNLQQKNIESDQILMTESPVHHQVDGGTFSDMDIESSNATAVELSKDLNPIRKNLERADEQLLDTAKTVTVLGSVEKAIIHVDKLSREIEVIEDDIKVKHQQLNSIKLLFSEKQDRRALGDKKLSALKYSLSGFSSSVSYFEQREARARAEVNALTSYLDHKKELLDALKARKEEIEISQKKFLQSEVELTENIVCIKSKLEEENPKRENEKVLFAIDNIEKNDASEKNWQLIGKATDLLKSEEEKINLQKDMKLSQEKLGHIRKELENLNKNSGKVESELEVIELEMQKGLKDAEKKQLALQRVIKEKEMLLEFRENGKTEIENLILEYQHAMFESDLKEAESKLLEEELQMKLSQLEELRAAKAIAVEKKTQLLDAGSDSCLMLEKMKEELQNVRASVLEAKSLLEEGNSNDS